MHPTFQDLSAALTALRDAGSWFSAAHEQVLVVAARTVRAHDTVPARVQALSDVAPLLVAHPGSPDLAWVVGDLITLVLWPGEADQDDALGMAAAYAHQAPRAHVAPSLWARFNADLLVGRTAAEIVRDVAQEVERELEARGIPASWLGATGGRLSLAIAQGLLVGAAGDTPGAPREHLRSVLPADLRGLL